MRDMKNKYTSKNEIQNKDIIFSPILFLFSRVFHAYTHLYKSKLNSNLFLLGFATALYTRLLMLQKAIGYNLLFVIINDKLYTIGILQIKSGNVRNS